MSSLDLTRTGFPVEPENKHDLPVLGVSFTALPFFIFENLVQMIRPGAAINLVESIGGAAGDKSHRTRQQLNRKAMPLAQSLVLLDFKLDTDGDNEASMSQPTLMSRIQQLDCNS
jgi:hypothetical protein